MEKYPWLSPYTYCGGNPIMYTDHDGLVFTERAQKVVDQYVEDIQSKLESIYKDILKQEKKLSSADNDKQRKIIKNKLSKLNEVANEMNSAMAELSVLSGSDQVYDIEMQTAAKKEYESYDVRGSTSYSNGTVLMHIPKGETSLVAHELTHAYQFETGSLSLQVNGTKKKSNGFYDYTDEEEAYRRGSYFGGKTTVPSFYNSLSKKDERVSKYVFEDDRNILQSISNHRKIIFRWKGHTYTPE